MRKLKQTKIDQWSSYGLTYKQARQVKGGTDSGIVIEDEIFD